MEALLIPLVAGVFLYGVIQMFVRAPGRSLASKFQRAGTLAGRSEAELVAIVGQPNTRTALAGGKYLLQWQAPGYHVALRFDVEGVCEGVTHEHSA